MSDFAPDNALPTHYRDDDRTLCDHSGTIPAEPGVCPRGCDGASEHYSNDGHRACADELVPLGESIDHVLAAAVATNGEPWLIEQYDATWGGWRKVRAVYDSEDPAVFPDSLRAQEAIETLREEQPNARFRLVDPKSRCRPEQG